MNFLYKFFYKYKRYIQPTLLLILVIFFLNLINQDKFIFNLKKINFFYLLPVLFILLLLPILITYRWFLLVRSEVKQTFKEFYNNIIQGYVVGSVTMFSFAMDILKFVYIQKYISKKKSLYLVVLDKLLSIYFKVIFLFGFLIILDLFLINLYPNVFNIIVIFLIFIFLLLVVFLKKILKKMTLKIFNIYKYKDYIIESIDVIKSNYLRLFLTNIIIQLITVFSYFAIAVIVGVKQNSILIAFFSPIIETITQLQFLSFGFREIVSISLLQLINISIEQALLISLFFTALTTSVTIFSNIYCIISKIK